ncbi:hypothetical protein L209DRAFT_529658 [Thermothelomyces heterothallicus CBS 203.75]
MGSCLWCGVGADTRSKEPFQSKRGSPSDLACLHKRISPPTSTQLLRLSRATQRIPFVYCTSPVPRHVCLASPCYDLAWLTAQPSRSSRLETLPKPPITRRRRGEAKRMNAACVACVSIYLLLSAVPAKIPAVTLANCGPVPSNKFLLATTRHNEAVVDKHGLPVGWHDWDAASPI